MLREKTANSPLLLIRRALQLFALAASPKKEQSCIPKKPTRAQMETFFSSFPGLIRCPSRRSSQSKGAVHGCAKSRIKSWGEMLNFPRIFSFSLRFFQRTTPFINRFLEEVTPNTYGNSANTLARETASDRHSYAKTNDGTACRCRFCAQPNAQPACVSPPPSVSFVHKKTAIHLPMDSCQKGCGR